MYVILPDLGASTKGASGGEFRITAPANTKSLTPFKSSVTLMRKRLKVRGNAETVIITLPKVSEVPTVAAVSQADHVACSSVDVHNLITYCLMKLMPEKRPTTIP